MKCRSAGVRVGTGTDAAPWPDQAPAERLLRHRPLPDVVVLPILPLALNLVGSQIDRVDHAAGGPVEFILRGAARGHGFPSAAFAEVGARTVAMSVGTDDPDGSAEFPAAHDRIAPRGRFIERRSLESGT